jgi:hypothetical protein
MKMGKGKGEKEKDKGFSVSWAWGGGDFGPACGAAGELAQTAHEGDGAGGRRERGPTRQREGVPTALGGGGDLAGVGKSAADEVPRWSSGVVPVPGGWGGGLLWPEVGGHGGGVNLADKRLVWPAHGEGAAFAAVRSPVRPRSATGEAKVVPRDRGEVVKLMS